MLSPGGSFRWNGYNALDSNEVQLGSSSTQWETSWDPQQTSAASSQRTMPLGSAYADDIIIVAIVAIFALAYSGARAMELARPGTPALRRRPQARPDLVSSSMTSKRLVRSDFGSMVSRRTVLARIPFGCPRRERSDTPCRVF